MDLGGPWRQRGAEAQLFARSPFGGSMAESKCPCCGAKAAAREQNRAFPFCSARCRTIDLGAWLTEEYRVPVTEDETERDGPGESQLRGPSADADAGDQVN